MLNKGDTIAEINIYNPYKYKFLSLLYYVFLPGSDFPGPTIRIRIVKILWIRL